MTQSIASVPLRGVRKIIAQHMLESLRTTAQLSYHAEASLGSMIQAREKWKHQGRKVSVEDCVIFALKNALQKHPDFNAVADAQGVQYHSDINLNIAISTEQGLMTPVLADIGALDIFTIAKNRTELVRQAQEGGLAVSQMKGGSITLSNLGHTRVQYFSPILNAGQVAILGVGTMQLRPHLDANGALFNQAMMPLSLTTDHRIIDGAPAGEFLSTLCSEIEHFTGS